VEPAGADRFAQSLVRAGGGCQPAVPQSYLRYLVNSLREFFELPGTPVRITLREKANPFAHKRKRPS
jgi:hypothetical protein